MSGEILFWAAYSVTMLMALGLMLGIRVPAKVLARVIVAGLVICGLTIIVPRLPEESIGDVLLCSPIAMLYLALFSVLTRGQGRR